MFPRYLFYFYSIFIWLLFLCYLFPGYLDEGFSLNRVKAIYMEKKKRNSLRKLLALQCLGDFKKVIEAAHMKITMF